MRSAKQSQQKKKGWGTCFTITVWLASVLFFSSCSKSKSVGTPIAKESDFDFFKEECYPNTARSGISAIVGGTKVSMADRDSNMSVMLIIKDASGNQSLCSSVAISEDVLLTAGHCLENAVQVQAVFHTDITCSSGYRRSENTISVSDFKIHKDYDLHNQIMLITDENPDLALVKLTNRIPTHYPIFRIHQSPDELNSDLYLYGFGQVGTDRAETSLTLRRTKVVKENYSYAAKNLIVNQKNKQGICQGDSGGAGLMIENQEAVVVSVNSIVFTQDGSEDVCNGKSSMVVVHHYLDWIKEITSVWGSRLVERK